MSSDPTLHLVATSIEVDLPSFEEFYEREKEDLFGALCMVTRNRQEAEQLAQDAFLIVYERWDRVAAMERPAGYLYRVAMNAFRSWNRRVSLGAKRVLGLSPPDDLIEEVDAEDAVMRVLAPLSPRRRAAVVLVDLLGYSSEDAGRILGIRAATVRTHVARAHEELRSTMGGKR